MLIKSRLTTALVFSSLFLFGALGSLAYSAPAHAIDFQCSGSGNSLQFNGSSADDCSTAEVITVGATPIVNKIADNLPLVLAITFTMSGVFWIVYKLIKAARLKRP